MAFTTVLGVMIAEDPMVDPPKTTHLDVIHAPASIVMGLVIKPMSLLAR